MLTNEELDYIKNSVELRPATKFLTATLDEQMVHITEEYAEVYKAVETYTYSQQECEEDLDEVECEIAFTEKNAAKHNLAEELVDLQTACETMLAMIGMDDRDRMEVRRRVVEKNRARGYYQEA